MSELVINISRLSLGVHRYTLETTPEDIGLDERFDAAIRVGATLEKSPRQLMATVELSAEGTFVCDRCLDDFRRTIMTGYAIMYVMHEHPVEGIEKEHEVQRIHPDANIIDLGEDVRQYIILAVPQKQLCRESCAGLCPMCGVNKNHTTCTCADEEIDPRWLTLKQKLKN